MRQRALILETKARRLDLGLSQQMVSEETGVLQSSISDLEAIAELRDGTVTLDTFMAYIDVLGLRIRLESKNG